MNPVALLLWYVRRASWPPSSGVVKSTLVIVNASSSLGKPCRGPLSSYWHTDRGRIAFSDFITDITTSAWLRWSSVVANSADAETTRERLGILR